MSTRVPLLARRSRRSWAAAVALTVACLLGAAVPGAQAAPSATAAPQVAPIPPGAGKGHAVSGAQGIIDLGELGYTESEYLMSGTATTYEQVGDWTENGRWDVEPGTDSPYTTRLLVQRPTDPAKFNGTVIVEWLNVSFGVDIPVDLSQSYRHMAREGYAYVGVTAQKTGADKLTQLDPERYGDIALGNDRMSYDVFSQAAQAVRTDPRLTGGGDVENVLATGHSQSAMRLTTYANAVQPVADDYDGIMLHGRPQLAAPVDDRPVGALVAKIRTDLDVPVFILQAETDVPLSAAVRQNTTGVRTWEVAGTAHADQYGLDLYNAANARDKAVNDGAPTYCDKPVNDMTFRYAENAALHHLDRWARGGAAPPTADPISTILGVVVLRDADRNALGGVRLPDLDVPIATYSPNNSGGNVAGACLLLGATDPFPTEKLADKYRNHDAYVAAFTKAADRARAAGHLLPADHTEAIATARARDVP